MMIEKETIRCEAVFSDDRSHRFLWKRVWDKTLPLLSVIMLNPCQADTIVTDNTTALVVNNVARLEKYGGVEIVNLYSKLTSKLSFRWNSDEELNDPENDSYIVRSASECQSVVLAWGRGVATNHRSMERVEKVLTLLKPYQEKLYVISDGNRSLLHPLTPSIRNTWILESYDFEKATVDDTSMDHPKGETVTQEGKAS